MKVWDYLKNAFLILIILQIIPPLIRNIKKQYSNLLEQRTAVGVMPIRGTLYDSSSYIKQLTEFFKDSEIKAILLQIECPGSASGTGELIFREIQSLKQEYPKPVIAMVENICTSGAYWIACAADSIVAPGTAVIGSIGANLPYMFQLQGLIENHHIKYVNLKAGQFKTATNPFVDITPTDQALLQGVLDDTYQQFSHTVARTRKLSLNKIAEWGDGKIFTGNQAKKLGLIDELGGPQQAVTLLKEKALIEGEIEWIHTPAQEGLFGFLFGKTEKFDNNSMFTNMLDTICTHLETRYGVAHIT